MIKYFIVALFLFTPLSSFAQNETTAPNCDAVSTPGVMTCVDGAIAAVKGIYLENYQPPETENILDSAWDPKLDVRSLGGGGYDYYEDRPQGSADEPAAEEDFNFECLFYGRC